MIAAYWRLLTAQPRFLAFGFLLAFISSFGQTFYIALFSGEIRASFHLSHGQFGEAYSIATLTSGLLLAFVGKRIDHIDLRHYAFILVIGLAIACLGMSLSAGVISLGIGIFMLRLFGQGLLSHAAVTSMARYFDASNRGKAVSFAALGFPGGEAVFPLMGVGLMIWLGWRDAWLLSAIVIVGLLPMAIYWLLRDQRKRHQAYLDARAQVSATDVDTGDQTVQQVLRDWRFYLAMTALAGPSFVITGIFFHQVHLVAEKGWSLSLFASGVAIYAGFQLTTGVLSGPLVDRHGARFVARFYQAPYVLALLALGLIDQWYGGLAFMVLAGAASGFSSNIKTTLWAELYGTRNLGGIRAMTAAIDVVASALSPALLGWAIDAGVSINSLIVMCAGHASYSVALLSLMYRHQKYRRTSETLSPEP